MAQATAAATDGARGARDLLLELELRRGQLRRNLKGALREAIQEGRFPAGLTLPSSRRLAADLGVSRGVVADVYDQLAAECYLSIRPRQAPRVCDIVPTPPPQAEPPRPAWRLDFAATTPDVELFPRRAWLRATERALRDAPNEALDYGDHRGRIEVRRALGDYLARVRGVRVTPERMVVTQGFTQALGLIARVLVARGATTLAFETPSLAAEWSGIWARGLRSEAVPVDVDGLRTDALHRISAHAILVTPAHQFPTGAVMAPPRRQALLTWAADLDALVIDDDYDAEFRYDRSGIAALQGLDPGRVVHIGTASKTMAPGIRLGWMSLPDHLVDDVREAKHAADSGSPAVEQLALADMLTSGAYDRHVARTRHEYRRRRDELVAALAELLPRTRVEGAAAGLHVMLRLPDGTDDAAVAALAAERGIRIRALSPMSLVESPERGLMLGYGRLASGRIGSAVRELRSLLRDAVGTV